MEIYVVFLQVLKRLCTRFLWVSKYLNVYANVLVIHYNLNFWRHFHQQKRTPEWEVSFKLDLFAIALRLAEHRTGETYFYGASSEMNL